MRPDYPIAYFYRGMTQQKLENYSEAIADYSAAIRLSPDSAVAYYYRAVAQQKLENISEAIADFELAAQFFWVRGSKTNAQKALKNVAKLRQEMALTLHQTDPDRASEALYQS
ncbi:tetratricopeptide repeat protein [Leptolyngbya sp. 7M]|uniref:tetratricopeptide repeat protein n=1 Tax=Leptolyngbya sp. 7M TaxID=2812896 RepID=UPI001B8D26AE|nr:tetratricopeptide repeat protein [Leptolyngbya sp. 7M]QYO63359.1 tetratricopeptide repeat protein [Leptolyngbya sp. 7M]